MKRVGVVAFYNIPSPILRCQRQHNNIAVGTENVEAKFVPFTEDSDRNVAMLIEHTLGSSKTSNS